MNIAKRAARVRIFCFMKKMRPVATRAVVVFVARCFLLGVPGGRILYHCSIKFKVSFHRLLAKKGVNISKSYLIAHSMGNIVAGEALKIDLLNFPIVKKYIAMQLLSRRERTTPMPLLVSAANKFG